MTAKAPNALIDEFGPDGTIQNARCVVRMLEGFIGESDLSKEGAVGLWLTLRMVGDALEHADAELERQDNGEKLPGDEGIGIVKPTEA